MTAQLSAKEKRQVMAALELACNRALAKQDFYRRKTANLPKPTPNILVGILDRVTKMSGDQLVDFFADYSFPSTWVDRELFGVRRDWEDDRYNLSQRYKKQIADTDIGAHIFQLNEISEHCDRIALEARLDELLGFRFSDIEKLIGKENLIVQNLRFLRVAVIRYKCLEWLGMQARQRGELVDQRYFLGLETAMKRLVTNLPTLLADFEG